MRKGLLLAVLAFIVLPVVVRAQEVDHAITVEQAHFFIVPGGERVRIAEYYLLSNNGNQAFEGTVGADDVVTTVTFTLPPGATDLAFDGPGLGERFVGDAAVFADTRPIPPGEATVEVYFSYDLPFRVGMSLERTLDVPVSLVALIVNGNTVGLEGAGLVFGGMMETEMGPAATYSAGPLAAGESLAVTFVPQIPQAASSPAVTAPRTRNTALETGIGLVALALGGAVSYFIWRRAPSAVPPLPKDARPLVAEIAALDARFAAGEVEELAYHQQRATLKQQLREYVLTATTNK